MQTAVEESMIMDCYMTFFLDTISS